MIEAFCTTCADPGPHQVTEDYGTHVLAVCDTCNHGFVVPTQEEESKC